MCPTENPAASDAPTFAHVTVLREATVEQLAARAGGFYVDVTLGGGGHTEALLERCGPDGVVLGVDRDATARAAAGVRLARFGDRARIVAGTMAELPALLAGQGRARCDGVLADLGVSSPQLDDAARGMSFRPPAAPLDMRMNRDDGPTARELLEAWSEETLADVLYRYGDERASRPIARAIKRALAEGALESTLDLARCAYRVLGPPRPHARGIDPATRTFQALRIAVNDELGQLEALLRALPAALEDGAVASIITFHSLEDRAVKHFFRDEPALEPLHKKPLEASADELESNPRARSAKLRAARRVPRAQVPDAAPGASLVAVRTPEAPAAGPERGRGPRSAASGRGKDKDAGRRGGHDDEARGRRAPRGGGPRR